MLLKSNRNRLRQIARKLDEITAELSTMLEEEQSRYDDMSEARQERPTGESLLDALGHLEDLHDSIDSSMNIAGDLAGNA